jgi:hypothetical protein
MIPLAIAARMGSAVSSEAQDVQKATNAIMGSTEQSQALFGRKSAVFSDIQSLANECAVSNWDGEDAEPISPLAVEATMDFIRALPDDLPLPEFAPEPDGSISLDWIVSRNRLFSMSIGATNRIAYAWLDGTDKGNAVARFDGNSVPLKIIQGIEDIMRHESTLLRAA